MERNINREPFFVKYLQHWVWIWSLVLAFSLSTIVFALVLFFLFRICLQYLFFVVCIDGFVLLLVHLDLRVVNNSCRLALPKLSPNYGLGFILIFPGSFCNCFALVLAMMSQWQHGLSCRSESYLLLLNVWNI